MIFVYFILVVLIIIVLCYTHDIDFKNEYDEQQYKIEEELTREREKYFKERANAKMIIRMTKLGLFETVMLNDTTLEKYHPSLFDIIFKLTTTVNKTTK